MFYNMRFTDRPARVSYSTNRAEYLKNNGLLYLSLRSDKDAQYNKGIRIDSNVYEINGFQIRFFTTQQIKYFLNHNFIINRIIEDYEEPASLYFVFATKQ